MRSTRTPPPKKKDETIEPASEMKQQQLKVALLCLANTLQGIRKRIKYQCLTRIVMKANQTDQKNNKVKFIAFFSKAYLRRKTQHAFDQILKTGIRKSLIEKAVSSLALKYKRMQKNMLRRSLDKIRVNHSESKIQVSKSAIRKSGIRPLVSPRLSEESEKSCILSVSEDSLADSKVAVFEDKKEYGNTDIKAMKAQNEELKRMVLSQEVKQELIKMQRFNRFNFNTETEKILKEPVNQEVKRLQKMKNQNKNMRTKLYDNELTIICLNNHIRMICQMNRQLQEGKHFQTKCSELQRKINEINSSHKKEMNEAKKRIMIADIKDKNIIQVVRSDSKQQKANESVFTHEQVTTLKVLGSALKARKYKDIKRQIEEFIKKSRIVDLNHVFRELLIFAEQTQSHETRGSSRDKERVEFNNIVNLVDKYIRAQKPQQIVTLKNKHKGQPQFNELCVLLETVVQMAFDIKKLKKKESVSADKNKNTAEKEKLKKSIQYQNDQLKKQLKNLEIKYNELETEHQKLKQTLKRSDRPPRPSMISRKPAEKEPAVDSKNQEMIKKIKELESNFQKKLEHITKETALKVQKAKQSQQKLQIKLKQMQDELRKKDSELADYKRQGQQMSDFIKYYEQIKKKMQNHENFTRELNDFKRIHHQSILVEIFLYFSRQESNRNILLNQLKNTVNSFNDNSWKRKVNILHLKGEGDLVSNVNQLIEHLLQFNKEKDSHSSTEKQLEGAKNRENKLREEVASLKEQILKLKQDIRDQKQELHESQYSISAKTEKPTTPIKSSRTPDKIQRSSERQLTELKSQNQKLKKQLSERSIQKSKGSTPIKRAESNNPQSKQLKSLQDAVQCFEGIKAKRMERQNYRGLVAGFKRKYPDSILTELFQLIESEDLAHLALTNQLKATCTSFLDGSWKRKQEKMLFQNYSDLYSHLNNLIEIMLTFCNRHEEHTAEKKKDEVKENNQIKYLDGVISSLGDGSWKKKLTTLTTLVIKEQNQVNSLISQLATSVFELAKERQQMQKSLQQIEILQSKNAALTNDVSTLKEQNSKLKADLTSLKKEIEKSKTPEKPKQEAELQKLKHSIEQKQTKIQQLETSNRELQQSLKSTRQYQQFQNLLQTIKPKKAEGFNYQRQILDFKRKYPKSHLKDFLIDNQNNEIQMTNLADHLKNIIIAFQEGTLKNKRNPNIKQSTEVHHNVNELVDMLISTLKDRDEALNNINKASSQVSSQLRQQIEVLRKEIVRLNKQNNQKSESENNQKAEWADAKERINVQAQQINKLRFNVNNLQQQKNKLKAELDNAIKSNELSNKQIQKLSTQNEQSPKKDSDLRKLQSKVRQLQLQVKNSQDKIQYYSVLFNKYKQERDNLYLIIEQKQEDYQNSKQISELALKEKKEREEKIADLNYRYEQTQVNIKKIQKQVDKLLSQRQYHQKQKQMLEMRLENQTSSRQMSLRQLRDALDQKNQLVRKMETQLELTIGRINIESAVKESQLQYQKKQISMLEEENNQLKARERSYIEQSHHSYSQTQIVNRSHIISEDQEKVQLRKQLELLNQQLASHVRTSESEKREMRQYIEKVHNDMQLQTMVYNEQKKILREGIERARNEEYEINHEKMRKLREDIHNLREENERLRSIIDTNEQSFNELIEQHRQMAQNIDHLTEQNNELIQQNQHLGKNTERTNEEKQEMTEHLHFLENRISELEREITIAIGEKNNLESSQIKSQDMNVLITTLTEEKKLLEAKYIEQNHNIIELHKNYYRLQAELNSHKILSKSTHSQNVNSDDSGRYLQDKLRHSEAEIGRLKQNERNLIGKIEGLMQTISNLERQKIEYTSIQRQKEFEYNFYSSNQNREIKALNNKINQLEQKLQRRDHQLLLSKSQLNQPSHETEMTRGLSEQNRKLNNQIITSRHTIESLQQNISFLQSKIQNNAQVQVQVKIINSKYNDLQSDYKRLQLKAHSYEQELSTLRSRPVAVKTSSSEQIELINQRIVIQKKDEELVWLKNQIASKDKEIHKLRTSELELINQSQRNQQKMIYLEQIQVKYSREVSSHQQTKRQVAKLEEYYNTELNRQKYKERNASEQLINIQEQMRSIQNACQTLTLENKKLKEQAESRKAESDVLREIVYQLDEDYIVDGSQEQLELKILQKISVEISELIECNKELKYKFQNIENSMFSTTEGSEINFVQSLHSMVQNILLYLNQQHLINHREVSQNLKQLLIDSNNSTEIYISNLSIFLRTLIIALSSPPQQNNTNYSKRTESVRVQYQNHAHSNVIESYPRPY